MQADFLNAHGRHMDDAERLFQAGRLANADHLYGLAAECGLKALSEKLSRSGLLDPKHDYVHVMEDKKPGTAWSRYQVHLSGHALGTKLCTPPSNPFSDWSASQRYAHESGFDLPRVQAHRAGAALVAGLMKTARKEGLKL
jgi:hypothetical protein